MTWDEMIELACSEFGCTAEILVRTPKINFSGSLWGARNPSSSPMTVKVSRKQDGRVTKVVHVAFIDGREVPKTNARRYFSASLGLPFADPSAQFVLTRLWKAKAGSAFVLRQVAEQFFE